MKPDSRTSNKIVPGRKNITDLHGLHSAGMNDENRSYLAEKTADESAFMDCSQDHEERIWRKQGLSEKEIFRIQEQRALKKHADAEKRLENEKFGARDFKEMCALPQYSLREDNEEEDDDRFCSRENVFAVPALPKHVVEKSIVLSPAGRSLGKPGFSCSTPKGGKDLSMRSLKTLDISHVVNSEKLQVKKVNVQDKNVTITIKRTTEQAEKKKSIEKTHTVPEDETSELQGTFTVPKDGAESLQGTFVVIPGSGESLQGTFVKETGNCSGEQSASLQGTFVKESDGNGSIGQSQSTSLQRTFVKESDDAPNDDQEQSASLQGTFVKDVDASENDRTDSTLRVLQMNSHVQNELIDGTLTEELPTAQNTMEGGEKRRKSKKVDLGEREKRMANVSSFINSMIDDAPSPGAHFFKNSRKKMRPTVATPPRTKFGSRLSTESDKEKTIEMLSIAEEATMESHGSSFADPISVNGSRVSPIPEKDETQPMEICTTPKSSRRNNYSLRQSGTCEKSRASEVSMRLSVAPAASETLVSGIVTPSRNYQKPTASSLAKSKNAAVFSQSEREKANERSKTNKQTPRISASHTPVFKEDSHRETVVTPVCKDRSISPQGFEEDMQDEPTVYPGPSNDSIGNVEADLHALSVNDRYEAPFDLDFDADYGHDNAPESEEEGEEEQEEEEERRDLSPAQRPKPKSSRRRVALLSDSVASVNTPGLDRRSKRNTRVTNDTVVDDDWDSEDEEDQMRSSRRRNGKNEVGLQLAKRKIIEPNSTADGLRRSTRTRVKPLRSWLGEQAVYVNSPSGGKRLKGVTDVIIKDKRLCKYRTADLKLATEREQKEKARKKARAAQKREQLAADQSMGRRLDESQDEIVTSDDE